MSASTLEGNKMKWHECGYGEAKFVNSRGRICGEVFKFFGGDYHASCEGKKLGVYIDFESAKKAVENSWHRP